MDIKITLDDESVKEFKSGTTVYQVAEYYQNKMEHDIIGAKINNEMVAMNTKLTKDCRLSFIDVLDPYGYRMYQAALKFIFEVAVKLSFPSVEVNFLHSVPKGIMAEIKGNKSIIKDDLNIIKENMNTIINNDEKITKYNVVRKDAITYFESHNQHEKAQNVHNTNNEIISFYKLKDYYNYYYTELPYSTKKLINMN